MDLRSDLARARGLGSTKDGTGHWWAQRLTAVALVPLGLWFVYAAVSLGGADLAGYKAWLNGPGNLLLMVLFVGTLFYHMQLGIQVVVEDYVHGEAAKISCLMINKLASVFLGVSSIIALFRVAFGG
ncbi:MAG: succinate dehydrogenase, hydrophobic membrane anchor protein [Rhodospirillales bacterium]|jgi:succinate dehydrogenase / fumarate reductase membrane anchor subunit|nr:succinate dehydrogenase, hydrophobic membrane anchor protein [Rhodospirillaceae bacterium]MDP6428824.1 succinate dehydrogenase, hydrophobic membrane anchor protein [Rhodospirillales bacterium]MDP6643985.1 succinate dehydrogenase, hydrophobic membrane anchor protein [Rhodospirillales bacterium]MDP6841116.1 succinate dehydrogenase, hydrophobic membrane anchor protein [Rhodospirillales bacterium]|tara:strand:- start:4412 stop:4792 length:381 start_codon:yes stop_codon:yes gene_type:complete